MWRQYSVKFFLIFLYTEYNMAEFDSMFISNTDGFILISQQDF